MISVAKYFHRVGTQKKRNEDSLLIDDTLHLYIVCDGSQTGDGEWAAKTACHHIQQFVKENSNKIKKYNADPTRLSRLEIETMIVNGIQSACKFILAESKKDPTKIGSLTTAEVLVLLRDCALLTHVGNSRTYYSRGGNTSLLTKDHTRFEEMVDSGMWDKEQVNIQYKKRLTQCIGQEESITVHPTFIPITPGDTFLLCTDGLSDYFTSGNGVVAKEFTQLLSSIKLEALTAALVDMATKKGSRDDMTAMIVQIRSDENSGQPFIDPAKKQVEVIRKIPVFFGIRDDDTSLMKIQSLINRMEAKKGQVIVEQGRPSEEMFILIHGQANVILNGQVVTVLKSGDVIGEMGFFNTALRSATVISTVDSELASIKKSDFSALVTKDKDLGLRITYGIIQELSRKIKLDSDVIVELKTTHKKH